MRAKAVDFFVYMVSDYRKSIAFYEDTLGLKKTMDGQETWAEFEVGGAPVAIFKSPDDSYPSGVVAFAVDDVDAAADEWVAQGATLKMPAFKGGVCRMAVIADPDDNPIIIHRRDDATCGFETHPEHTHAAQAKAVDFFVYEVSDYDKAKTFYENVLHLDKIGDYGGFWAEYNVGGATFAICKNPRDAEALSTGAVALAVDDVDATLKELADKGVNVVVSKQDTPVCHFGMALDPDGNAIWLHRRKDGTCG
ncbi:MAG: VOC family protein [Candidatus Poribacteria bacterium]|nr:VOC family protein [Candidatus Poribacteria bacterium]